MTPEQIDAIKLCVYCGEIATERDHVPAKRVRRILLRAGIAFERAIVDSCKSCNSMLGGKPLVTLADRRAYIRHKLWRKNWKLITSPSWGDSEIAQLGESLGTWVRSMQQRKQRILRRIGLAR